MKKAMKAMKVPELPRVHIAKGVFYPTKGKKKGWACRLVRGPRHSLWVQCMKEGGRWFAVRWDRWVREPRHSLWVQGMKTMKAVKAMKAMTAPKEAMKAPKKAMTAVRPMTRKAMKAVKAVT